MLHKYKSLDRSKPSSSHTTAAASIAPNTGSNNVIQGQGQFKALFKSLEAIRALSSVSNNNGDGNEDTSTDQMKDGHRDLTVSGDSNSDNEGPQVAILFCIIDEFPNELIWRMWLRGYESKYQFYFHAKYPERVRSPFVRERLLGVSYRPNWGTYEIVKAMLALLEESTLRGPRSLLHFCFASESCVPIMNASKVLAAFPKDPSVSTESWLNYMWRANNGYAQKGQFEVLEKGIPSDCICKADQWCMLSRQHALMVLSLQNKLLSHENCKSLVKLFKNVKASDEMYVPVAMALLGIIRKDSTCHQAPSSSTSHQVKQRRTTYVDWTENSKNPKEYKSFPRNFDEIRKSGCIFMRKIKMTAADASYDGSSNESQNRIDSSKGRREVEGHVLEGWINIMAKQGCNYEAEMQTLMEGMGKIKEAMNIERQKHGHRLKRSGDNSSSSSSSSSSLLVYPTVNGDREASHIEIGATEVKRQASNSATSDVTFGWQDAVSADDIVVDSGSSGNAFDGPCIDSSPKYKRRKSDDDNRTSV